MSPSSVSFPPVLPPNRSGSRRRTDVLRGVQPWGQLERAAWVPVPLRRDRRCLGHEGLAEFARRGCKREGGDVLWRVALT